VPQTEVAQWRYDVRSGATFGRAPMGAIPPTEVLAAQRGLGATGQKRKLRLVMMRSALPRDRGAFLCGMSERFRQMSAGRRFSAQEQKRTAACMAQSSSCPVREPEIGVNIKSGLATPSSPAAPIVSAAFDGASVRRGRCLASRLLDS
jgi:hypothetical protein